MKTFLALSLLASNILSLLVRCGVTPHEDPNIKLLVDNLCGVDKDSFIPKRAHQDGVESESINASNTPDTTKENIPYADFFRESSSVQTKTTNKPLAKMAGMVMNMMSSLGPTPVPWGEWLGGHDIKGLLELAEEAFDSDVGCDEEERLWAVGILAAIWKYLPPDEENMTANQKFKRFNWSNQVYIEIQASKDHEQYMSQKFKSVVKKDNSILGVAISPGLEERLRRAEIFGRFDDERKREFPCLQSDIYTEIILPNHLKTNLPTSDRDIQELITDFRGLFKKIILSDWEGRYALAMLQHLLNYSFSIRNTFQDLLQDYNFFRDMHLPFAKRDVEELLEKHQLDFQARHFKELKDCIRHWHFQEAQHTYQILGLWDMLEKKSALGISAESLGYIYKLMIAFGLINRSEEKTLLLNLEKAAKSTDSASLAIQNIWSVLCPDGLVKKGEFGEYQWVVFMRDLPLLQIAKIHKTASNMKNSISHSIQQMGIQLEDIIKGSNREIKSNSKRYFSTVLVNLKTMSNLSPGQNVYKMDLESIRNLIKFNVDCTGPFLELLGNSQEDRKVINTAIMHIIRKGTVKDDLEKDETNDLQGIRYVALSCFGNFLITLLDIIDQMNTSGYQEVNYKKYAGKLREKFDIFNLSVGGQAFAFNLKPPRYINGILQLS